MDVTAFIEYIGTIEDETSLIEALNRALLQLGFVAFNYGSGHFTQGGGLIADRIWSTLDPNWINYYAANRYYRDDRLVRASLLSVTPFRYERIFKTPPTSSRQREMEKRFGYRSGVVVPIHRFGGDYGVLSAARPNADPQPEIEWPTIASLQLLATAFHERVRALPLPVKPLSLKIPALMLTARERQCLVWASAGKTNKDIRASYA